MTITNEEIIIFLIAMAFFISIYLFIFYKKGINKEWIGYAKAISNCILISIACFITLASIKVTVTVFQESKNTYDIFNILTCAFPIFMCFIFYRIIKIILKNDFGLEISIFKHKEKPREISIKDICNNNYVKDNEESKDNKKEKIKTFFKVFPFILIVIGIIYLFIISKDKLEVLFFILSIGFVASIGFVSIAFFSLENIKIFNKDLGIFPVKILAIPIIILGLIFIFFVLKETNIENAIESKAVIVDAIMEKDHSERGYSYYPVIKYIVNNEEYEVIIPTSLSENELYRLGLRNEITILYNSKNPYEVILKPNTTMIGVGVCLITFGVLILFTKPKKTQVKDKDDNN